MKTFDSPYGETYKTNNHILLRKPETLTNTGIPNKTQPETIRKQQEEPGKVDSAIGENLQNQHNSPYGQPLMLAMKTN